MVKDIIKFYKKEYIRNWNEMSFEQLHSYNTFLTRLKKGLKDEIFETGYKAQTGEIKEKDKPAYIDLIAHNILMLEDIEIAQIQCETEMKKKNEM